MATATVYPVNSSYAARNSDTSYDSYKRQAESFKP